MKQFIITLMCAALCLGAYTQTVTQDKNGNYVATKAAKDSTGTATGKTYTDTKGNVFPVMISKNGKLYVMRISKKGIKYNQYLKL